MRTRDLSILLLEKQLFPANLSFTYEQLAARQRHACEALTVLVPLQEKLRGSRLEETLVTREKGTFLQIWLTAHGQQLLPLLPAKRGSAAVAEAKSALEADLALAHEMLQRANLRIEKCARILRERQRQHRVEPRPDDPLLESLIERESRRERSAWELSVKDGPLQIVFPKLDLFWREEAPRTLLGRVIGISEKSMCLVHAVDLGPTAESRSWPVPKGGLTVLFENEDMQPSSGSPLEQIRCGHWIGCTVLVHRGTRTGRICGASLKGDILDYGVRPRVQRDTTDAWRLCPPLLAGESTITV